MKYKVRPGIVLEKICGKYLLIPDHNAAKYCNYVKMVGLFGSSVWQVVENDKSMDDLISFFAILTKKTNEQLQKEIDDFLDELYKEGFLILNDGEQK